MRINDLLYGKPGAVPAELATKSRLKDGAGRSRTLPSISSSPFKTVIFYLNDGQVYSGLSRRQSSPWYPDRDRRQRPLPTARRKCQESARRAEKKRPNSSATTTRRLHCRPSGHRSAPCISPRSPTAAPTGDSRRGIVRPKHQLQSRLRSRMRMFNARRRRRWRQSQQGPSNYPDLLRPQRKTAKTSPIVWSLEARRTGLCEPVQGRSRVVEERLFRQFADVANPACSTALAVIRSPAAVGPDGGSMPLDARAAAVDAENWPTCSGAPQICTGARTDPLRRGRRRFRCPARPRGLPVAVANRTVYVVTNLGAVAAPDAGGGSVKWIRVYDRTKTRHRPDVAGCRRSPHDTRILGAQSADRLQKPPHRRRRRIPTCSTATTSKPARAPGKPSRRAIRKPGASLEATPLSAAERRLQTRARHRQRRARAHRNRDILFVNVR